MQFAVAQFGLTLAPRNGVHRGIPERPTPLLRWNFVASKRQPTAFYSEETAAVGKNDYTRMLKLVPFVRQTGVT